MTEGFGVEDKTRNDTGPNSELDIYQDAIDSTVDDEGLLGRTKLGLGYYDDKEYWQQVDSYRAGMFGHDAFASRILDRAIEETKTELAVSGVTIPRNGERVHLKGWDDLDDDKREEWDRRRFVEQRRENIWESMSEDAQEAAIIEVTGITSDWTPPQWEMMQMRHESSRSRGARLIDNLFGRIDEIRASTDEKSSNSGLLNRGDEK